MTKKRYFKKEWEEEYYIFDSTHISEEKVDEESEYDYNVFAEFMQGDEVVDKLNEQEERIRELEWSNKILRANRKDCERGRIFERKQWDEMDKMRVEHIKFLQKRLKKNGLSIYINDGDINE